MTNLRSLVAANRAVLLIDSASTRIHVGLWRTGSAASPLERPERERLEAPLPEAIWHESEQEAGIAVFAGVEAVLARAGIGIADLGALVFCEGPGSILGIRTAAMALRIWSNAAGRALPAFSYRSLELVAHELRRSGIPAPFAVIADARRNSWHRVGVSEDGVIGPLRRVPADALAGLGGRLFTPAGFRSWAQPPDEVMSIPYALPDLWRLQADAGLLRSAPRPDAFLHEEVTYAAWTPQIHQAAAGHPGRRART